MRGALVGIEQSLSGRPSCPITFPELIRPLFERMKRIDVTGNNGYPAFSRDEDHFINGATVRSGQMIGVNLGTPYALQTS
jgi:hypothetical protein